MLKYTVKFKNGDSQEVIAHYFDIERESEDTQDLVFYRKGRKNYLERQVARFHWEDVASVVVPSGV